MPQTWNPSAALNETYTALSTTTSQDTITIQSLQNQRAANTAGTLVIQLRSDTAWYYAPGASAALYPVNAGEPFNLRITDPTASLVIYVKAQTSSGTLYGMRVS